MTGVDVPIQRAITTFSNIWALKNVEIVGRVYRNNRENGIIPETFTTKYIETLINDKKDGTIFFDVRNPITVTDSRFEVDVWIMFALNLSKLYESTGREDEQAHADAIKWINKTEFKIERIVLGFEAFSQFSMTTQNKDDMHPYHLFRVETRVKFNYQNC